MFVGLLGLVAYRMYQGNFMATPRAEISYTRFIQEVDRGNIDNLQIIENVVSGKLKSRSTVRANGQEIPFESFRTNILGDGADLPERVWRTNPGIEVEVRPAGFNWFSFYRARGEPRPQAVEAAVMAVAFLALAIPGLALWGATGFVVGRSLVSVAMLVVRGHYVQRLLPGIRLWTLGLRGSMTNWPRVANDSNACA